MNWSIKTEAAGFLHARAEAQDTALALACEASVLNPMAVPALRVQASCEDRLGQPERALAAVTAALTLTRKDPGLLLDFARYAAQISRNTAALDAVAEAISLNPDEHVRAEQMALQSQILTMDRLDTKPR